jgi:long-chain acyl-CoA synthetase
MQCYYKNPEATSKAIDSDGFFDTGDLGKINVATGDLILTGRCKDTIVLSNGENIEPQPIEDKILSTSDLIEQVMLMGDDGRRLIAVTVLDLPGLLEQNLISKADAEKYGKLVDIMNDPKFEKEATVKAQVELAEFGEKLRANPAVSKAVVSDLKAASGANAGFRAWEGVQDAYLVVEPFAMSNGLLTQSFKVKRAQVAEQYGSGG